MNAIIDLGTNTFNLLIFEQGTVGLRVVHSVELPVFLGRNGIEKGIIAEDAFQRGLDALRRHTATAHEHGAQHITGFGTSMLRIARNAGEFVRRAQEEFGIAIAVIPGDEEAGLILDGVRQAVPMDDSPALIMDIGGGSTEFIIATAGALLWKRSFEVGVTRLRDRIPISDPMTVDEELRIGAHLDEQLAPLYAELRRHRPMRLIGCSGSFDSLARMMAAQQGVALSQEEHTKDFPIAELDALHTTLRHMDRAQRLRVPGLPEHRVDTLPYALVQIGRVLAANRFSTVSWSRYALKEGAAWRMYGAQA
jgi:exopolyphosphatase/guanosine-5'-triphosphate,3'-diphosphate pyrophosphatase